MTGPQKRASGLMTMGVGILLGILFLGWAVIRLDWGGVAEAFANARPLPWIPLGVLSYLLGHVVRGLRCRLLLSGEVNLPLATASNIVVTGYAVNNLLPFRLGEIARVGLLSDRTGIPLVQSAAVTLLERLLDGLVILLLFLITAFVISTGGWIHGGAGVAAVIFGLASSGVLFAVLAPNLLVAAISRAAELLNERWRDATVRFATSICKGVEYLRAPRRALTVGLLSLLVWLLEAGMFTFFLPVFGLPLDFGWGLLAMSVTNLAILIPSSPGFIGPFHLVCKYALVSLGVAEAVALSYAVAVHLAFYVPITIWGVAAIYWYGIEIGGTIALAKAARRLPPLSRGRELPAKIVSLDKPLRHPVETTPFMRSLIEAVIPEESVGFGIEAHRGIVADTTAFVQSEIDQLPQRLKIMFAFGMFGFRFTVRLTSLAAFSDLSLEKRRAMVERWAYGRLTLARSLFRVVRSTALLFYYEVPVVEAALGSRSDQTRSPVEEIE